MNAFLLHPCAGYRLSQRFGVNRRFYPPFRARNGQMWPGGHEGLDFATPLGTPIVAAHDGVVRGVTRLNAVQRLNRSLQPPYGNHVRLETVVDGLRVTTIYAHLDSVTASLKRGSVIDAGQVIGLSGNTGRVLGDQTKGWHLHFGVNIDDYPVDPEPLIVGGGVVSIGANILAAWVDDRARMMHYLAQLKPAMVVVCDEPAVAAQIKAALPATTVIHRWVVDGDGSHTNWSPDAWVRSFALQLPPGVMGYLLNEPGGNWRELSAYLVSVMSLCAALNIPLCVGNFSKGNPPQAALNAGELDALLLAFNDFPLHRLGYHPYWATDPDEDEHAQWHIPIQRRAKQIGARVKLFATESGRDVSGAYSDGYRAHMSNATYGEREVRHARTLHAAGIDQAPYAYGKGGPETVNGVERFKWEQFDHQNNAEAQAAFLDFNAKVRNTATMPIIEPPKPGTPAVTGKLAALPASYTYRFVRALPDITSEQTGVITLQEPADYYPGDVRNGWMYVRSRQTPEERGWMYQQGVTFLPDQPPASRPVTLTRAEYTQILSILTDAEKRQGENP